MPKESVIFICTHNSVRSQMAEGLLRARFGERYEVYSAGKVSTDVNAMAIQVMDELGIDIGGQRSETVDAYLDRSIDHVVTVCDHARETCPHLPGQIRTLHRDFFDPGTHPGSDEEMLEAFREVRDELDRWIREMFDEEPAAS